MDPPEKSAVWAQDRRELRVVVLLRLGCPPVYRLASGSSFEGMPQLLTYEKSDGEEYKQLSGVEYADHVRASLGKLNVTIEGKRLPPAKYLLHDKCPAHTAKAAKKELSKHIQLLQLPTDSPTGTPCDTSFFAAVKGRWQKELAHHPMPWARALQGGLANHFYDQPRQVHQGAAAALAGMHQCRRMAHRAGVQDAQGGREGRLKRRGVVLRI